MEKSGFEKKHKIIVPTHLPYMKRCSTINSNLRKAMDRQKDGKGEYSYENGEAHGEGAAMAVHKISHIA